MKNEFTETMIKVDIETFFKIQGGKLSKLKVEASTYQRPEVEEGCMHFFP